MGVIEERAAQHGIVIALDGGGTKTDCVALTLSGRVVARVKGLGSAVDPFAVPLSVAIIDDLVRAVIAGCEGSPVLRVHAYLAGLDLPVEIDNLRQGLAHLEWSQEAAGNPVVVENDIFALLRTGTDELDAVGVVCGTGINAVGTRADGATIRFPALGEVSGDSGGGLHIGSRALWHAVRAGDGRGRSTSLLDRVPEALGYNTVDQVTKALHFRELPDLALSTLTPVVFDAASEGDEVAGHIIDAQAEEIVVMASTVIRRLGFTDREVPVVLGGGVIASGNQRLLDGIANGLGREAPRTRVRIVGEPPVIGTALLTLEAAGADASALAAAGRALSSTAG